MDSSSPKENNNKNSNNIQKAASWLQQQQQQGPPKPMMRSEPGNPYPTTFVQADTSSFKQVVQMLTGSSETAKQASCPKPANPTHNIPPIKSNPKKQQFKLYERRNSLKNLNINPLLTSSFFTSNNINNSPRKPDILSPSILDFPALVLSPVTPLIPDPFNRSNNAPGSLDSEAEEKAIKEKGFFLHPSPASTPRDAQPRLLPLFPTTSPRASGPPPPPPPPPSSSPHPSSSIN